MFGEKYGDVVRVVDVPGVSMELCGGTHVGNTAQVGAFRVLSESGVASGVRRIEAVAGGAAVDYLRTVDGLVRQAAGSLKVRACVRACACACVCHEPAGTTHAPTAPLRSLRAPQVKADSVIAKDPKVHAQH
jgi:alanyl-tRNA synthetase